jgi:hypothetical protein
MSTHAVAYAAGRFLTVSRGALHVLARIRDDMATPDAEKQAASTVTIWAEECTFLHQAWYDAAQDLELALRHSATVAKG